MISSDILEFARRASFIGEGLALLLVGKMVRDLIALAKGYKPMELIIVGDNAAAAIDIAGFLLALVLGLLGSLVMQSSSWAGQATDIAKVGLLLIVSLVINSWITDKLIFRGLNDHYEIYEKKNVSLALGRAASAIATALVIRGALGQQMPLLDCLGWVALGQGALVGISLLYQWVTPYDDLAEITKGNIAAGLPMAGILLAAGMIVEAALLRDRLGWGVDRRAVVIYLGASIVLLWLMRTLTDRVLMPGAKLADEIVEDKNIGAGVLEATSFVIGAELLAYFLN